MKILVELKRLAIHLEKKQNSIFNYPCDKQKAYLKSLPEPKDDVERSFLQYKCQMKMKGLFTCTVLQLASLPLLVYFYFRKSDVMERCKAEAVAMSTIGEKLVPKQIKEKYESWEYIKEQKQSFDLKSKAYFGNLVRSHPLSWHFLLKCLIKIRQYNYVVRTYKPKIIVTANEYSFTSSVMTDYCGYNDVKHINAMHGEKLFFYPGSL